MDDLIRRQAAIDALARTARDAFNLSDEYNNYLAGLMDGENAIRGLSSAQQEQRWIPVSERLPNTNGVYNVTRNISDGFECKNISDTCYYDGTNTWHDDTRVNHGRRYLTDVIAWMPLPEPYKGEPS